MNSNEEEGREQDVEVGVVRFFEFDRNGELLFRLV